MTIELRSGFIGLATNTADLQAPPGALARANNVVIRRAGSVETRPGIKHGNDYSNVSKPMRLIPYELETVFALQNDTWWNALDDIAIVYPPLDGTASVAPPLFRDDLIPYAQTRGNLYVGTSLGVMRFTGSPDATSGTDLFIHSGLPSPGTFINPGAFTVSATGTTWLANNFQVNYRVVLARTDVNGLTVRSRPSGAINVSNTSGAAGSVLVSLAWASSALATRYFDTIEVYRTRQFPTSSTIDEEYQLVKSVSASGTNAIFRDYVADSARGATLYTSPSREGYEGTNLNAPACGAMAVFKGALFTGNTISRAVTEIALNNDGDMTGVTTGFGSRGATCTTALGSNQLTLVSSTTGVQKGMIISNANFAAGTYITNIVGATITASTNATAAGALVATTFYDAIEINGVWTRPRFPTAGNPYFTIDDTQSGSVDSYWVTPPAAGFAYTIGIETYDAGSAQSIVLRATHGGEMSPALPLYGATAKTVVPETKANGLSWSKPDEPEHFPPANFAMVGDKKREILALASTRDALFIVKEDGVWRLTGVNGQYRIDPFDLTTRCVLPSSVVPLRNKIYLLATQGVVSVSDEGVQIVSRPIADQLKHFASELTVTKPVDGGYYFDGYLGQPMGYAGAANERDNEYMLIVYDQLSGQASGITKGILVYNADTQAWTSWSFQEADDYGVHLSTIAWHEREGTLWIGQIFDTGSVPTLALPGDVSSVSSDDYRADAEVAITVSVGGTTITYSPALDMNVGDLVYSASDGVIRAVTGTTSTTVVTLDSAAPTGSAVFIRPISATVRPRPFISPNQVQKLWTQVTAEATECVGVSSMSMSALSSVMVSTSDLVETPMDIATVDGVARYNMGGAIRAWMPTQAARGWKMISEIGWSQAFGKCSLEAIMSETREGRTNAPNLAVGQ